MVDHEREFWIRSAVQGARNPSSWLHHAEALRRAADQLELQIEGDRQAFLAARAVGGFHQLRLFTEERRQPTTFVYAMLMGFAIENLAKGLLVAADPDRINEKDSMFPDHWGHISEKLLHDAGLTCSTDERKTVRRLEAAVLWTGRYPVAKRALRMRYRLAKEPPPGYWDGSDTDRAKRLYDRLSPELRDASLRVHGRNEREAKRTAETMREGILSELKATCISRVEHSATLFERPDVPADPGTAVTCVRCGCQFTLNSRTVAAVCRCDIVYRNEPYYDGSLGRWMPLAQPYPPAS